MKANLYTFIIFLLLSSCTSIQSLVEKGDYDTAFNIAVNKLSSTRKKKTDDIKALEKAYALLQSSTLNNIDALRADVRPENWERVHSLYLRLESRQGRITSLLPLISKDGYKANINIVNYRDAINHAADQVCAFLYDNAIQNIATAKRINNKTYARRAYEQLSLLKDYRSIYKDADDRREEALQFGLVHVGLDIDNKLRFQDNSRLESRVRSMSIASLDNNWVRFTTSSNIKPDYIVVIEINDFDLSPEREVAHSYEECKDIKIRTESFKEKRDTIEVWVEKEIFERIKVQVTEVNRYKEGRLNGLLKIYSNERQEYINSRPINVRYDFHSFGAYFFGDQRALSNTSISKVNRMPEIFPSDLEMTDQIATALNSRIAQEMKKTNFIDLR